MRISDWSSDVCSSDLIEQIEAQGTLEVQLSGRSFRISRDFIEDIRSQPQLERIGKLRKALLVFHSPVDTTVGVENAAQIFAAAKHPKSFVSLENADHLLSRKEDAEYVANVIAAWAERYLDRTDRKSTRLNSSH